MGAGGSDAGVCINTLPAVVECTLYPPWPNQASPTRPGHCLPSCGSYPVLLPGYTHYCDNLGAVGYICVPCINGIGSPTGSCK
jgi:hypothetical protein